MDEPHGRWPLCPSSRWYDRSGEVLASDSLAVHVFKETAYHKAGVALAAKLVLVRVSGTYCRIALLSQPRFAAGIELVHGQLEAHIELATSIKLKRT